MGPHPVQALFRSCISGSLRRTAARRDHARRTSLVVAPEWDVRSQTREIGPSASHHLNKADMHYFARAFFVPGRETAVLVFIDESGHPRPNDPTKRPTILAACIEENKLGQLSRTTYALQRSLLSQMRLNRKEREGKASELMTRRALTKNAAKREFAEAFFDRLRDFPLTVFAVVAERPAKQPYEGADVLQAHHRFLLERINLFMERDHPDDLALLIYDNLDPGNAAKFAASLDTFMSRGGGKNFRYVVPSALFADSEFAPGIQVADRFAYVVRLNEEEELYQQQVISDPYLSTIKRYAAIVRSKTRNYELPDVEPGFLSYGISTIGADKFIYEAPVARSVRAVDGPVGGVETPDS